MSVTEHDLYGVVIATLVFAALGQGLRLISRFSIRAPLWYDDYFSIIAFAFACGWAAVVLTWVIYAGLGRPIEKIHNLITDEILMRARLFLYTAELVYAVSLAFSKFAILAFYWRLFRLSSIRLPIQILAGCSAIWLLLRVFVTVFHCLPVQAFWDKSITNATCAIDDSRFFFGSVLAHLVIDLAILALPVLQVRQLKLQRGQKFGVIAVFMFGFFVCMASVAVLCESLKFDPNSIEMPRNVAPIMLWATIEINFAIVSASLPMMRPLFVKVFGTNCLASKASKSRSRHTPTMRMQNMSKTKKTDDSSSTRELTSDLPRPSNVSGFEPSARLQTVVSCPRTIEEGRAVPNGILVRNETLIHVETAPGWDHGV